MILLDNEQLWMGTVGDSRAFLDNGESLSEDATPLAPRYKTELENRGAQVYPTGYFAPLGINVSRVIGYLRSPPEGFIVNSRPKIVFRNVKDLFKESDHVILMSDGVGRAASIRQLAQVVRKNKDKDLSNLAINIIHSAYRVCVPSSDNLSMLILRWNKGDTQSTE